MALVDYHVEGPLRQGDLLKGLTLYRCDPDGDPVALDDTMGVVVSRHCNALRAQTVLVAAIRQYRGNDLQSIAQGEPSLDEMRRRFDALRNGDGQPDSFYLGTLRDHHNARFAARLDSIHAVEVPTDAAERDNWIESRRFARLSDEHRRHLHVRLFAAISSEGFDDLQWWADEDLEMIVLSGRRAIRQAEAQRDDVAMKLQLIDSESLLPKQMEKKRTGLCHEQAKAIQGLKDCQEALRPYEEELRRRGKDTAS